MSDRVSVEIRGPEEWTKEIMGFLTRRLGKDHMYRYCHEEGRIGLNGYLCSLTFDSSSHELYRLREALDKESRLNSEEEKE